MIDLVQEFRKFAMRNSVVDFAVGIVIGAAFQKIIASFVSDIALPAINPLLGIIEFQELTLGRFKVGSFLEATINFIIIAFCVFFLFKAINSFREYGTKNKDMYLSKQERVLIEIRDLLKEKK